MAEFKKTKRSEILLKEIETISKNYFHALKQIKEEKALNDSSGELNEYQLYVARVRYAYHTLNSIDQIFINNEFFFEDYPRWWEKRYTPSAFYKQRLKSMKNFKEAFENAY